MSEKPETHPPTDDRAALEQVLDRCGAAARAAYDAGEIGPVVLLLAVGPGRRVTCGAFRSKRLVAGERSGLRRPRLSERVAVRGIRPAEGSSGRAA